MLRFAETARARDSLQPDHPFATSRSSSSGCCRCGLGFAQPLEARELIGDELALFVAADEDLEHRAAADVDELDRAGSALEERPIDEIDRRATGSANMAAEGAFAMDVEIAASLVAGWERRFGLEYAVLGVHDERHCAPECELAPD